MLETYRGRQAWLPNHRTATASRVDVSITHLSEIAWRGWIWLGGTGAKSAAAQEQADE